MLKGMLRTVKRYLSQPETGAGLLFVALAFAVFWKWIVLLASGGDPLEAFSAENPRRLYFYWTVVSFAVSTWLAFQLLRRHPDRRAMRRMLLVAVVHAVGAIRFYDWGLVLLSVLPVFALAPAYLLPQNKR